VVTLKALLARSSRRVEERGGQGRLLGWELAGTRGHHVPIPMPTKQITRRSTNVA
jgi:hypothetical protein